MIPSEKDRLECLRLAVMLYVPKSSQLSPGEIVVRVTAAAEAFHEFISSEERKA